MTAFEIFLNGKRLCTVGLESGVVSTILNWVNTPGANPRRAKGSVPKEFLSIHAGGLDAKTNEHLIWKRRNLKVGDAVSIRVVEVPKADKPRERIKREPRQELRATKKYVRQTARKLGWQVVGKKKSAQQRARKRTG
ncbi:hypothetical protein DES53_1193 [Roseimicrobium gellanilyticum]|uniref:Uncharacterized protein n=1 Tax=Roseimicrobium gellanilyticum TaxID=748857 RepID=A0A366H4Q4_9BACT|nr:hypothetical protein [Roseimicrobium gellanilyticum]RBP35837.1 hypothetical protein DES53_1193 [Roseimicrobium gellanilyticum]